MKTTKIKTFAAVLISIAALNVSCKDNNKDTIEENTYTNETVTDEGLPPDVETADTLDPQSSQDTVNPEAKKAIPANP
jgi:hypothetical protein